MVNGRFKVHDRPVAAPGCCSVCGSVERPVVDFGTSVDFYGAVVICTDCIREAAEAVAYYNGESASEKTQAASPIDYLDAEAINEYVRMASSVTDRLSRILAPLNIPSLVDDEEDAKDDGDVIPEPSSVDDPFPQFSGI